MKEIPSRKESVPPVFPGPGGRTGGPGGHFTRPKEKARDIRGTLGKLWARLRLRKAELSAVFLILLVITGLNVSGPYLTKYAIDRFILAESDPAGLMTILAVLGAVYLCAALLTLLKNRILINLSQRTVQALRQELFDRFQELGVGFFDRRSTGELMSRMTNDIDSIGSSLGTGAGDLLASCLSLGGVTVLMLWINWRLGLICLGVIPLVILTARKVGRRTRSGFRARQRHLGDLNGLIEETLSGQKVVKAFAKEEELIRTFSRKNEELRKASYRAGRLSGLMGPVMNMMNNLNYGVTAFAGGALALYGLASVGTIAAFLSYTRQFSRPLNQLAQQYTAFQSALAGAERVFALLEEETELKDLPGAPPFPRPEGEVLFRGVGFGYAPGQPVLQEIELRARPGETIALVGPTGAGKTTIINLLTRFYDPQEGSISIDGRDIRSVKKADLRRSLGVVLQDSFLFSGTLRENLRYGRTDATDREIEEAARLANAHRFISQMPEGYDTELSENGSGLSQGQRQLLAIARAILSDPAILILDEATSSVDTRTEEQIQQALLRLMAGRTSFVIAHRLSTIKKADRILVIKGGRIVEEGAHGELLNAEGEYARLYRSQFGREEASPAAVV